MDSNTCSCLDIYEQVFVEQQQGDTKMAIAPIPQQEEMDLFEMPWPKPMLRLVTDSAPERAEELRFEGQPAAVVTTMTARHDRRSVVQRRRVVAGVAAGVLLVLLALPVQALGGVTATGKAAPGGVVAGLADGSLYVVQPGDTVASVAHELNPAGDQGALQAKIRGVVGSSVLVPGEHILLP